MPPNHCSCAWGAGRRHPLPALLPEQPPRVAPPRPPPHPLPPPQGALWLALFHSSSSLLADFHRELGDMDIRVGAWRLKGVPLPLLRARPLP